MRKIIQHFGIDHQRRKFAEENLELQEAIMDYQLACRNMEGMNDEYARVYVYNYRQHLIEELADNFVLLGQFMSIANITNKEIEEVAKLKIERTHKEMEK